jgi:hypothetical protein
LFAGFKKRNESLRLKAINSNKKAMTIATLLYDTHMTVLLSDSRKYLLPDELYKEHTKAKQNATDSYNQDSDYECDNAIWKDGLDRLEGVNICLIAIIHKI